MRIFIQQLEELLDGTYRWHGSIAVPLEIGSLPEHLPHVSSLHEGGLGHGLFDDFGRPFPSRTNLEDLNAVTGDSKTDIELWPDMNGRPSLLYVRLHGALNSL